MEYFSNFGAPLYEGFVSDDKWQCKDTNNTYEGIKFKLKKMNSDYSIVVEVLEEGSDGDVIERTLRIIGKNFDFKKHADNTIINSNSEVDLDKLLCIDYSSIDFDGEPITVEFEWGKDKKVKYELMDEGDGDDVEPFYNYQEDVMKNEESAKKNSPYAILRGACKKFKDFRNDPSSVTTTTNGEESDNFPEITEEVAVSEEEEEAEEEAVDEEFPEEEELTPTPTPPPAPEEEPTPTPPPAPPPAPEEEVEGDEEEFKTYGGEVEGFVGNNGTNIGQNLNVRLLLKSLLFACLFYLLAHNDTKKVLLNVVKLGKDNYLYLATVLFFVAYLILNILV